MKSGQPVRLYSRGTVLGFKRGHHNQHETTSLVKIEGVNTKEDVQFYLGKRVAFIYRAKKARKALKSRNGETKVRVIWGKVTRSHGTNGVVRTQFRKNLPSKAMGARVRVMLYPSTV